MVELSGREKSAELCNQARNKRQEEGEGDGGLKEGKKSKEVRWRKSVERCKGRRGRRTGRDGK